MKSLLTWLGTTGTKIGDIVGTNGIVDLRIDSDVPCTNFRKVLIDRLVRCVRVVDSFEEHDDRNVIFVRSFAFAERNIVEGRVNTSIDFHGSRIWKR